MKVSKGENIVVDAAINKIFVHFRRVSVGFGEKKCIMHSPFEAVS